MFISILIVCYTAPKPQSKTCQLNFYRTNKNPIEYQYGSRSISIGDFDNDTYMDMVIANSIINGISIYRGSINVTFSKQIQYSTGSNCAPNMVIVDDINNDYRLDILVANIGTNNVGIFLGFGAV
ncbi:unnamed protein product [Adineta ricciae]|nr:unnamed protein product [Adineta ricciae]